MDKGSIYQKIDSGSDTVDSYRPMTIPIGESGGRRQYLQTEVFYEGEDRNVVNSNQWRWLKSTLKNANKRENRKQQPWIIVAGHRPIYCSTTVSEACPDYKLQSEYEDLFFKYGVDIVFSGHEHDYERSYPIYQNNLCTPKEDNPYINPCAPIYIISGAAGNFRGQFIFLDFQPNYIAYRSRDVSYTRLTAYNSTDLYLEQVSVDEVFSQLRNDET
ncbi:acid phosphatase type 7-like [Centruroides sculpturatus]|uniref:acid phosphatase type 7-like n=1 Tax=Centruroides sculpturatus TaxID=218467 RepID=UPI000C6D6935|nr:acid phosphatase type 7-like [Centruroides sculpturatus]